MASQKQKKLKKSGKEMLFLEKLVLREEGLDISQDDRILVSREGIAETEKRSLGFF